MRHVYATRLANADGDPMHLKDLMGHNDFNITLGFFKIREDNIAQGYFAAIKVCRPSSFEQTVVDCKYIFCRSTAYTSLASPFVDVSICN